jgi:hypothetical protein
MAVEFVQETGEGLSNATSYCSIAEMEQYWDNQDYDYSAITTENKQRYLNKATSYIDNNYRRSFPGYRLTSAQALEWPRYGAYYVPSEYEIADDIVPVEIKNAVNEMAYIISQGTNPVASISKDGKVIRTSSKVDVIETSTSYEEGTVLYNDIYTAVDDALSRVTGGVSDIYALTILRVGGDSA